MVSCCILHCKTGKSVSAVGFILKCFPKNENLKDLWIKSINRPDWSPTLRSCVCQLHFSSDMWEIVDNVKKLKADAVPTIFPKPPERKKYPGKIFVRSRLRKNEKFVNTSSPKISFAYSILKKPAIQSSTESNSKVDNQKEMLGNTSSQNISHGYSILKKPAIQSSTELKSKVDNQEQAQQENIENTNSTLSEKKNTIFRKCNENDIEKLFRKQEEKIRNLQSQLKQVMKEKRKLLTEKNTIYKAVLLTLFNEDQISNLIKRQSADGNSRPTKWSNSTIEKALHLQSTCGNSGYEELLKQGYPLPSRRTLSRKVEHIMSQPEISDEMLNCLEIEAANTDNENNENVTCN